MLQEHEHQCPLNEKCRTNNVLHKASITQKLLWC